MTAPSAGKVRVGVDIGGTFTDFIVLAQDSGRFRIGKRLTTPGDPSRAVLDGLADILQQQALQPGDVSVVVHATTLVTNTVIERTGAAVGLIATQGCRDVLEIGTESRYDLYDLFLRMPEPLVPRYLRKTIEERLGPGGVVLRPLARASAERAIRELLDEGVEAIAVALLHSYADPVHELQVLDLVREQSATIPVTLSSALIPEIREYERTLAAVMNAYVQPKVRDYIARLTAGLELLGVGAPLYVMQSNGGLTIPDRVVESPVGIIESGPAAGAVIATYAGRGNRIGAAGLRSTWAARPRRRASSRRARRRSPSISRSRGSSVSKRGADSRYASRRSN